MKKNYKEIYWKRIAERTVAADYYTHQGVSQGSEKLQCDTPFLMKNQSMVEPFSGFLFADCS